MSQLLPSDCVAVLVKDEPESDSEEVQCRLCHKSFASTRALKNHAFMDHLDACISGDPAVWTLDKDNSPTKTTKKTKNVDKIILKRKQDILSSMTPTSLTSLASNNVSYIIVKSDDVLLEKDPKKKKIKETRRINVRSKEPQVISGPFECLEASPLGADGACHQIFFSCCEYSAHARAEHSRRPRAARCQVCERPLAVNNSDAPYVCEQCGTGFEKAEELQDHKATAHVKVKPYQCTVCNKRFTQQGGVVQHMRMHTGQRPYPCTFCEKAFTQKSGLEQHIRTHTKHKPYHCVVCSKRFAQSVHLRQHMRTHTQLAPFHCPVCDKRFKQSSHLNYHLRYHDPAQMSEQDRSKLTSLLATMRRDRPIQIHNVSQEVKVESQTQQEDNTEEYQEEEYQEEEITQEEVTQEEITQEEYQEEEEIVEAQIQEDSDTYIISDCYGTVYE